MSTAASLPSTQSANSSALQVPRGPRRSPQYKSSPAFLFLLLGLVLLFGGCFRIGRQKQTAPTVQLPASVASKAPAQIPANFPIQGLAFPPGSVADNSVVFEKRMGYVQGSSSYDTGWVYDQYAKRTVRQTGYAFVCPGTWKDIAAFLESQLLQMGFTLHEKRGPFVSRKGTNAQNYYKNASQLTWVTVRYSRKEKDVISAGWDCYSIEVEEFQ